MCWRDLLFVHWRVDPDALAELLPEGLEVDTFDGHAWLGLIPFRMDRVRFFGLPSIPTLGSFPECNVRTYVLRDGVPGVWFFSLDAASRLAVLGGRNLWKLNYIHARFMIDSHGDTTDYRVRRSDGRSAHLNWTVGERLPASEAGSLPHFLTERYYLYAGTSRRLLRGAVWHEPWTLRRATLNRLDDEFIPQLGVETLEDPVCMAADPVDVLGWTNRRV